VFLCLPHLLYTGALTAASLAAAVCMGILVAVSGRVPARLAAFQALTIRERVRCYSYFFVLRSDCPAYPHTATLADPGGDRLVSVSVVAPPQASRWSLLVRPFVAVPHLVVLVPIGLVMDACYPVWMLIAAANRGWPEGFERFLIRVEKWVGAVLAYLLLVTNEAPRFGLAAYDDVAIGGAAPATS
jgi:hypothetical protein